MANFEKNMHRGKRPGKEAERTQEDSRRKSARDEDEQHGGHLQVDAFDKGQAGGSTCRQQTQIAKVPRTALNDTPSQMGTVPLVIPQKTPTPKLMPTRAGKMRKSAPRGWTPPKNSVKKDGIEDKKSDIRDYEEDLKASNAEAKWGQRSEKHGGAQLNERLTGCDEPWGTCARIAIHGVEQNHRNNGKEKAQKPEQGARVAEAEIKVAEGGEEQRRQDEGREMIKVGHGNRESPSPSPESADPSILADPGPVLAREPQMARMHVRLERARFTCPSSVPQGGFFLVKKPLGGCGTGSCNCGTAVTRRIGRSNPSIEATQGRSTCV